MSVGKWDRIGIVISKEERARLRHAANERGLSEGAIIYSLLWKETQGFHNFDGIPEIKDMPRTVIVRKVQAENA